MPQGSSCEYWKKGKTRLRKTFPALDGVRPRANPVCPFASHSPRGGDAGDGFRPHGVPWRAAKCRENRLSAFILHSLGARGCVFPCCSRPAPRLRGSRRSCLDILSKCHLEHVSARQPFGTFAARGDKRRPTPPKEARKFPRAVFLPFPGSLKYTAVSTGFRQSQRGSVEIQWGGPATTPVSDCHPSTEFPAKKKGFPSASVFQ